MSKPNISVGYGNDVWLNVPSATMPHDTQSLRNFLEAPVSNGERVRDLLIEDGGMYRLVFRCKEGTLRTTEGHLFLEKLFVESTERGAASACTVFVSYPSNKTMMGAAFMVTPLQPPDGDLTISQVQIRTTQDVYLRYNQAKSRLQLGAAGAAIFGLFLPVFIGEIAVIPAMIGAGMALSGVGEMALQKFQATRTKQIVVPDQHEYEITATVRSSPGLIAVQNVVGAIVRKNNELWVYGFPIEGNDEDISIAIPPSAISLGTLDDKLLVWVGGEISLNGKRVLDAMSQDSALIVQSNKKARSPVIRFVFPEMMVGVASSHFIDASKLI